jgi:hypothetical protein
MHRHGVYGDFGHFRISVQVYGKSLDVKDHVVTPMEVLKLRSGQIPLLPTLSSISVDATPMFIRICSRACADRPTETGSLKGPVC